MRIAGKVASIAVVLIVAATMSACGGGNRTLVPVRDLLDTLDQADRRPADAAFDVAPITLRGETHRAVATPAVSRMTWELHLPDRAVLQLLVAVKEEAWAIEGDGVLFRVGIGEGRTHEDLVTRLVNPFGQPDDRKWIPLTIDLGPYSGFKWSLFYHPRDLLWRIVLNTNAGLPGSTDSRGDLPLWGEPRVLHQ
jgi:hypothetical protein